MKAGFKLDLDGDEWLLKKSELHLRVNGNLYVWGPGEELIRQTLYIIM